MRDFSAVSAPFASHRGMAALALLLLASHTMRRCRQECSMSHSVAHSRQDPAFRNKLPPAAALTITTLTWSLPRSG